MRHTQRVALRNGVRIFRSTPKGVRSLLLTAERVPAGSIVGLGEAQTMRYGERVERAFPLINWQGINGYLLVAEARYLEIIK